MELAGSFSWLAKTVLDLYPREQGKARALQVPLLYKLMTRSVLGGMVSDRLLTRYWRVFRSVQHNPVLGRGKPARNLTHHGLH